MSQEPKINMNDEKKRWQKKSRHFRLSSLVIFLTPRNSDTDKGTDSNFPITIVLGFWKENILTTSDSWNSDSDREKLFWLLHSLTEMIWYSRDTGTRKGGLSLVTQHM